MSDNREEHGSGANALEQATHDRRSALRVFGTGGIFATVAMVGARVHSLSATAKTAVGKSAPWQLASTVIGKQKGAGAESAAAAEDLYSLSPGWAAWTQSALNVSDGWSESSRWMSVIENSHGLPIEHNTFLESDSASAPHHWGMVIDLRKCIGCQSCVVACKSENNVPVGVYRTWVQVVEVGQWERDPDGNGPIVHDGETYVPAVKRFSLPRLCNHCDDPPCVEVCPVKATFKREDGLVLIDYPKCIGCGYCIQACPYDARYFNPIQQTADKCTFCVQRIDRGLLPACVTSCVGRARIFGDLNDPDSEVGNLIAQYSTERLNVSAGTHPQVYYIQLDGDLVDSATAFNTIYPYAAGTNTNQYEDLTGKALLETSTAGEGGVV
jgi:tetrathionate reductase subunit B